MKQALEEVVKTNLTKFDIDPDPQKGQHFLIDERVISRFYREVSQRDIVIEIGPGFGQITQEIVKKAKKVIAIEIDKQFYISLKAIETRNRNLQVLFDSVLSLDLGKLVDFKKNRIIVLGNLPFQIIEPLFSRLIVLPVKELLFITGIRFLSEIGATSKSSEFGKMTFVINTLYSWSIISELPQTCFYPEPATPTVLIKFIPKLKTDFKDKKAFVFRELILSANKGKKIKNVLREGIIKFEAQKNVVLTKNQASILVNLFDLPMEIMEKPFEQLNNLDLRDISEKLDRIIN